MNGVEISLDLGRRVDGFTVDGPYTAENQKTYPQNPAQAERLGFPILRCVCLIKRLNVRWDWSTCVVRVLKVFIASYGDDLRIAMDNNAAERKTRNPAVGRKDYYGSGATWARSPGDDIVLELCHA